MIYRIVLRGRVNGSDRDIQELVWVDSDNPDDGDILGPIYEDLLVDVGQPAVNGSVSSSGWKWVEIVLERWNAGLVVDSTVLWKK